MNKVVYKLIIGFLFGLFVMLSKLIFSKSDLPFTEMIVSKNFWVNFFIFFAVGYVLLGNLFWMKLQKKNKK